MNYSFDPNKWALHQLPPLLRKTRIYAFLKCIMIAISEVYGRFKEYASEAEYKLSNNGYTRNLEKFLNDLFSLEGEITIEDYLTENVYLHFADETPENVYVGLESEGAQLYLPSVRPDELSGGFKILIPSGLETEENLALINRWVNYYKTAGTTYKIETYE